ncbi:MAG: FmdB family transcriptional regulator [Deltaproteobacteria bacterium HGW-Deltaproteobacteria-10]|nr:MAG: FmdB family transcriptional regulator [Deltaproteobacteria bacterium HGW-Deltaproteobacteria-10]
MPIYEYQCRKCGKQFEAFQSITDPELKSCKFCKGKVAKLVSMSSFSLKGAGWYATDYGGKKAPASSATAAETSPTVEKSDSSSESATSASTTSKED